MCAEDYVERLLHLLDVQFGTGVERLLYNRLFSTGLSSESALECLVASHTRVDFCQSMSTSKDTDESVRQLLARCMSNRLLQNHHLLLNWF